MIKAGTILQLEPIHNDTPEKYRCRVVESEEDGIFIDYPIHTKTGKTVFMMNGTQLKASFVYNEQTVLTFESEVLGRKISKIPMIHIHYPGEHELVKVQRRQFVRVETNADISLYYNDEYHPAVTEDISAGGCAVRMNGIEIEQGARISMMIVLVMQTGECHYLEIAGSLVRVWERNKSKIASIQFLNLTETQRQIIMRYCFEKQLELRKKGMLE
ncbi:flagellar brake protein [Rossellomorea aquimaris]|jgi:c-di-GMP-binding flagellar brake protein YcgR|uniref:Pilus assembly protein PilZ n=1 Tax=Rossellomorea aquimaris TaxID=189382 RepID=A0A1J6W0W0_9BACI|nr:flagellar brake domain-containing protein [Rossellomorea aquimaris]OIU71218.1 pilus assembly protein PilZ [Rossellomorea aquimaris]